MYASCFDCSISNFKLMELPKYSWWGGTNPPPDGLKTKRQLTELGLSPRQPVAIIECQKYDVLLYDPDNSESVKPKRKSSDKQLAALEKSREKQRIKREFWQWYKEYGYREEDRTNAVLWARKHLAADNRVILDTETTSLDGEIVEIAVIDCKGNPLINTLVKPLISISSEATRIHGISDDDVFFAPSFTEVYPQIKQVLDGKIALIYNASFDVGILNDCCNLYNLPSLFVDESTFGESYDCLMAWYSQWYGEWSNYYKSYKWKPLNGGHRALGDCLAALNRLKEMAADSSEFTIPDFT